MVGVVEQAQFVVITVLVGTLHPLGAGDNSPLAAHSGMLNVFGFMSCAMFGLTDAGSSTVGTYLGAGKPDAARRAGKILLMMMLAMASVVAVLFFASHAEIGHLFSKDPAVIKLSSKLSMILGIGYTLLSLAFACFGTLQGQGRPHIAAASMFVGLWGVSLPMAYLFGFPLGNGLVGVWWGLVVGYAAMTSVMIAFVLRSPWARLSLEAQKRSEKEVSTADVGDEEDGGASSVAASPIIGFPTSK